ncbi:unknown [Clostridium sp. CAG:710]|nr:unknown [Clostridium sp. CAG:710]
MIEHLNFFLYNHIFELIVGIPFIANFLFIEYLDNMQTKTKVQAKEKFDKIRHYKVTILFLASILATIYIVSNFKNIILTILIFILPLFTLIKSVSNIYSNKNDFTLDTKYINVTSTIIFIIFFSGYVTPVYLDIFANIPHMHKEILLILYLIIKIILFVFLTSTNIFVLISNINTTLKQKISKSISDYFIYKEKDFTFINYDFYLYRKYNNKLTKIIDIIIFSILSIPTITLNLIIIICLNAIKIIKNKLFNLFKQLENKDKWNLIIKKSTNISIIIAFIIVYIIMVLFKEQFFPQIIDIFTYLSTVILLPLIYDSIKSNK